MLINKKHSSSFRDPSGFIFYRNNTIYRQINKSYKDNYDFLINCGLYKTLADNRLLIPHLETEVKYSKSDAAYKTVQPEMIPFISYPYEWCFNQLKDAALTTLKIQKKSLEFGMSLKDCSAYNIQFKNGKPILIDTLSFAKYNEGEPWIAYRQFCQHFLAPLSLMSHNDIRLNQLLRIYIDGVPLDLASTLLPFRTHLKFFLFSHIHLHARSQKYFADKSIKTDNRKMRLRSFFGIIDSLESGINKLKWKIPKTEWVNYYSQTHNYSSDAFKHKKQIVENFLGKIKPKIIWDLGGNVGEFSRIASDKGIQTISFDIDPAAVEMNYLDSVRKGEVNILPLMIDITNPSPGIGWENKERHSLFERTSADTIMALALIHHLAITNNLPLYRIVQFFNLLSRKFLIIEFVPKSDSQVQKLISTRADLFPEYKQQVFEDVFQKYFKINSSKGITDSKRVLYLMEKRLD